MHHTIYHAINGRSSLRESSECTQMYWGALELNLSIAGMLSEWMVFVSVRGVVTDKKIQELLGCFFLKTRQEAAKRSFGSEVAVFCAFKKTTHWALQTSLNACLPKAPLVVMLALWSEALILSLRRHTQRRHSMHVLLSEPRFTS